MRQDFKILVFGSSKSGIHASGIARIALNKYGASFGYPIGRSGMSYAIPVWDKDGFPLPDSEVARHVSEFLVYASEWIKHHPDVKFGLTNLADDKPPKAFATFIDALFPDPLPPNIVRATSFA